MAFSKKAAEIKRTLQTDYGDFQVPVSKRIAKADRPVIKPCKHSCSAVEVKLTPMAIEKKTTRECVLLTAPIVLDKRTMNKSGSARHYLTDRSGSIHKVEPFVPIQVPSKDRNRTKYEIDIPKRDKEIQIFIDDSEDKECFRKLYKKIHTLTAQLAESEAQRVRLKLQLDHISRRDISCKQHQKIINKLQGDNYKMQMEIEMFKKKAQDQARMTPKETIKEMVLQKPIQVRVQVPKYIPGPQRIIQKIVEVPKYVQIQKKIPQIIVKEIKIPQIVEKPVFVQKPIYQQPIIVDKPIFVDKPIYIDKPVEVQRKVQVQVPVEIEVPVYIDRPIIDEDWLRRFHELQEELGQVLHSNQVLKSQNFNLKKTVTKLQANMDMLSHHNNEKNRQVQFLLSNKGDYLPTLDLNRMERKYSALDRTSETLSPRSQPYLRYL